MSVSVQYNPSITTLIFRTEDLRVLRQQTGDQIVAFCTGQDSVKALLEAGYDQRRIVADIRYIQAMLGHASLNTTQLYTQVSIRQLKDIHTATHPGRMINGQNHTHHDSDHDALLAALDIEAEEEGDDA